MKNAFIIHGVHGYPGENWFPWLKKELEELGYQVHVPAFPTPENQTLESWLSVLKNYEKYVDEDTIFIGHSLGPAFILTVLEGLTRPIKAAYLVAGYHPHSLPKDNVWYESVKTFLEKPFDWEKIRKNCKSFYVYHSDDDPYFPLYLGENLAKALGTEVRLIKNAGHFNEKAGYLKFEELLEAIKQ